MSNWIIPANGKSYDHFSSFENEGVIDWIQNRNYEIGDVIYVYYAKPYSRITFKCIVQKVNIHSNEKINDKSYWRDLDQYEDGLKKNRFARLKLVNNINSDELSADFLKSIGVNSCVNGLTSKLSDEQVTLIEEKISSSSNNSFYTEIPSNEALNLTEGTKMTVTVNKYERNTEAREKCIKYYGCKCQICGLNFEEMYGEIGKGFIHVHHLVPLYKIGKDYVVDYKKDLIPVCPNCHSMIHRLPNLEDFSVDDIRKKLLGK